MTSPRSKAYYPSRNRLLLAWALLLGLTLATMLAGRVTETTRLGPALLAALFVVTWVKAGIILRTYLNLRTVPAAADALMIVIGLILAIVATLYVLAP